MYVDESGDTGMVNSPTRYFALSGITVHESRWRDLLNHLVAFRRTLKAVYGLPLRTEVHASEYIRKPPIAGLSKYHRLAILRNYLDELAKANYISITNVVIDKSTKTSTYDVFDHAWQTLFQRFENTIKNSNFPGQHSSDKGMVLVDNTDGRKLQLLTRKMAAFNPIPSMGGGGQSRNMPVVRVIEDPHHKNSADSYFIQSCDVCAYFVQQSLAPSRYVKKQGAQNYIRRLAPVLNLKARYNHPLGIVIL